MPCKGYEEVTKKNKATFGIHQCQSNVDRQRGHLIHHCVVPLSRCGSVTLGQFSLYHIGEEWNASENMVVACRGMALSFNSLFSLLLG